MQVEFPENTYAFIAAVENYQFDIKNVDFAACDAHAFKSWLMDNAGVPEENIKLWVNRDVTKSLFENELPYEIRRLGDNDRFIFYYAGHGLFDEGHNKITTSDTHPSNLRGTSVSLLDVLINPLRQSRCNKSILFIDSCSSFLRDINIGRDIVSEMRNDEFIDFIRSSNYRAMFLSCSRGEKSYGNQTLQHGIWTYHLLEALKGNAPEALERGQFITNASLQNYLRQAVPRFIRERTQIKGTQTPWSEVSSNNTFVIHEIPLTEEDTFSPPLAGLRLDTDEMYFRRQDNQPISRLPGFNKKRGHFIPDRLSPKVDMFISELMDQTIQNEIQSIYDNCKEALKLRRRDITRGERNIDTVYFRFSIDTKQDPDDPENALTTRKLVLNMPQSSLPEGWEDVFPVTPNEIVMPISGELDYDELVKKFEDAEEEIGGRLDEDERTGIIEYTLSDGGRIIISTVDSELIIKPRVSSNLRDMLLSAGQSFQQLADSTLYLE
ncbi:caspase family protein [Paenibacillus oralis]|uniref:Caspase family protein n=1 Tax=Paenibacillus oralis TaxID=2490856 RepID=A0A3P3T9U0_9BACL|nr:caspase family protein [Paenibacillus oralis]RRJ54767.1 caspase family protein [Paenibacillus oralis]